MDYSHLLEIKHEEDQLREKYQKKKTELITIKNPSVFHEEKDQFE